MKYQKALNRIFLTMKHHEEKGLLIGNGYFFQTLQELIDMHTKPLKLEEIKEGMFVWDSKYEAYAEVHNVDYKLCELCMQILGHSWVFIKFEENRYYRYQPLSEV